MLPTLRRQKERTAGNRVPIMRFCVIAVASVLLVGCYTLVPTGGIAPEVGTGVALDINDAGRLALGGSMGPEIAQIEGQLIQEDSSEYLIAVETLRLMRGGEQQWKGEKVRIKTGYVTTAYERRFSRGRTIVLTAVGIGAVALLAGKSLRGSGSTDPDPLPKDTASAVRIPHF
jgi:hypothetical protein